MDTEAELLRRVVNAIDRADFFRSALLNDTSEDWKLVKELGEFLVRVEPESELMGHALLLRAYRHLGDRNLAENELRECKFRMAARPLEPWEGEMLVPILKTEERVLFGDLNKEGTS